MFPDFKLIKTCMCANLCEKDPHCTRHMTRILVQIHNVYLPSIRAFIFNVDVSILFVIDAFELRVNGHLVVLSISVGVDATVAKVCALKRKTANF